MTTWYAQNSNVDIDSVNQWNDAPDGSGNWLTWADLDSGDVLVTNGKNNINVSVPVTCATITNAATGGTAGGAILWTTESTITADIASVAQILLTATSSGDRMLIGNITTGTSRAFDFNATGSLTVVGNVTGGSGGVCRGIQMSGTQTATIIGDCIGGSGNDSPAIYTFSGTIHVTGNVIANNSYGIQDQGSGTLVVNGDMIASSTVQAIRIVGATTIRHTGNLLGASTGCFVFGEKSYKYLVAPSGTRSHRYATHVDAVPSTFRTLYTGGVNLGQPVEADVRQGTTYGAADEYTGSLIVPDPAYVALGVPTDDTVGTLTAGLDQAALHTALDAYTNKGDWKATGFATVNPDNAGIREAAVNSAIAAQHTIE